jgi:hypothetical protein
MGEKAKPRPKAIDPRLIPRRLLSSDENVVFESRPSRWFYMKSATLALIVAVICLVLLGLNVIPDAPEVPYLSSALVGGVEYLADSIYAVLILMALSFFTVRHRHWTKTAYAATDERVMKITRKGLFRKIYEDIPLGHIEDVRMAPQSNWEWFCGCGTLNFSTKGAERIGEGDQMAGVQMRWEGIPRPLDVRSTLQEFMDTRVKLAIEKR